MNLYRVKLGLSTHYVEAKDLPDVLVVWAHYRPDAPPPESIEFLMDQPVMALRFRAEWAEQPDDGFPGPRHSPTINRTVALKDHEPATPDDLELAREHEGQRPLDPARFGGLRDEVNPNP